MSLIRLNRVTKKHEDRMILRDISLKLDQKERTGLVGRNGTGKTTILKLMLGLEQPTEGTVDANIGVRIGYFSQTSELSGAQSIQHTLEEVFAEVQAIESELESIATQLDSDVETSDMDSLIERQAELFDRMTAIDGWEYRRHIDTVLTKLGFNEVRRTMPVDQLSGGWRNRASLAKILLEQPDILLLDEPTNFLDVAGVAWLENWLTSYRGGVLIVSHDREFLDGAVTQIVEIENYKLHEYPGNYTDYVRAKQFRIKTIERQFEHEEELLLLESEAASDRREYLEAGDDASRRKLADIKKRRPPRPVQMIVTDVYAGIHVPDNLFRAERLGLAFGDHILFDELGFELHSGDRLAIVGSNGSGKSSLLKLLTAQNEPTSGKVTWERGVTFADFNAIQAGLDPKDTVTHSVNTFGLGVSATRKQVNKFLGLLEFSELNLQQRIGTLSGGQQARVALARCLLSGASVLILDEPTNHLDLNSIQVMEQALIQFPGAIVVVSHDRFFLDKLSTRLLVFEDDRVQPFDGTWSQWELAHSA